MATTALVPVSGCSVEPYSFHHDHDHDHEYAAYAITVSSNRGHAPCGTFIPWATVGIRLDVT